MGVNARGSEASDVPPLVFAVLASDDADNFQKVFRDEGLKLRVGWCEIERAFRVGSQHLDYHLFAGDVIRRGVTVLHDDNEVTVKQFGVSHRSSASITRRCTAGVLDEIVVDGRRFPLLGAILTAGGPWK
jgi:hypothetical protein